MEFEIVLARCYGPREMSGRRYRDALRIETRFLGYADEYYKLRIYQLKMTLNIRNSMNPTECMRYR
jgi:hypothetical protein